MAIGPTELLVVLFVFGIVIALFGAIARAGDVGRGARRNGLRDPYSPRIYPPDSGGTHLVHDDSASAHPHGGHPMSQAHLGHDPGHSHPSGFDSSTSFDVGFGAGGDAGFSGGGFDGGSSGGCDSGGGGGGGGD